jgi:hypothetical protein
MKVGTTGMSQNTGFYGPSKPGGVDSSHEKNIAGNTRHCP